MGKHTKFRRPQGPQERVIMAVITSEGGGGATRLGSFRLKAFGGVGRRPGRVLALVAYLSAGLLCGVPVGAQEGRTGIPAGPAELTLEAALGLAREYNPDFRVQEAQIQTADLQVRGARGDLLPSASVSNSYGYQASGERRVGSFALGTQPDYYSSSYNLSLSFSMNGTSLLRPGQARAQARAAEARVDGAALGLRAQVTDAYLSVLQADAQVRQAETALERVQLNVLQASAQVQVGVGTPLDIRRAEVQEGQSEVQLVQSQNQAMAARLGLARLLGVALPEDVSLVTEFELFDPALDVEELLSRSMETNPVLRASRLSAEATAVGIRQARTQYLPNVSLSAGVSGSIFQAGNLNPLFAQELNSQVGRYESCIQDNRIRNLLGDAPRNCAALDPADPAVEAAIRSQVQDRNSGFPFGYRRQPLSMSLSFSLPLFTGFSRRQAVEEARLATSIAREQVRAEELRLRSEVGTAVRFVETARRTVELQERIRATATEELRMAQERFRLGLASSLEVADAQANLSQAERDEINALYDFHKSMAALESLVGGPVR
jgi:outer membrane protein